MHKILITMAAIGLVVIAVAFIARPKPCGDAFQGQVDWDKRCEVSK